jgi:putative endonuclease
MIDVYILKSIKDGGYYIGISKDVIKRLEEHNNGKTISTKNRRPFILVYKEQFLNYSEARKREIQIKSYKGGNKFREIVSNCSIVPCKFNEIK